MFSHIYIYIYINTDQLYRFLDFRMDLPQGPHTQLFLDPLGARGALVASAQATESDSFVSGGLSLVVCTPTRLYLHGRFILKAYHYPSIFWVLVWTIASFRGSQWIRVERRMSVLVIAELSLSKSVRPRKPLVFVQLDMDPSWIDFSYNTQGDICSWGQAARWSLALEFLQLSLRSRIEDRPSHSAAARTAARARQWQWSCLAARPKETLFTTHI